MTSFQELTQGETLETEGGGIIAIACAIGVTVQGVLWVVNKCKKQ